MWGIILELYNILLRLIIVFVEIATGDTVGSKESFVSYTNAIDAKVVRNNTRNRSSLSDTRAAHYISGKVPGSSAGDVFTGIKAYCSSQGVSHPGGFDGYNDNYVIGRVDTYGTPFLLLIYGHPKYHDHWITGYGYNISGGTCYSIVNDGWGDTNISINPIDAQQIVW